MTSDLAGGGVLPAGDLPGLLAFAHRLADAADAVTLPAFRSGLDVETKGDGTPVTEADRGAESAIRAAIRDAYPDHAVLGEEQGRVGQDDAPTWVIDPIDGTRSFVTGNPVWATLIGLVDRDGVAVSVVSAPAMGHRWDGLRTGPARRDGRPIRTSEVDDLAAAQVTFGDLSSFAEAGRPEALTRLTESTVRQRGYGDFWGFCLVAEGVMDICAEAIASVWDFTAVQGLVEAAGGRFSTFDGRTTADGGSGLATNGRLHDAVLALLR